VDIVEILIGRGCNVNMRAPGGLTPLCLAVIHGDVNLVRTLLSRGARQDRTHVAVIHIPIQIAAFQGAKDVVDLLLHYGPDSTRPTTPQIQDAIQCTLVEGHGDIIPPLLATGVGLNYVFRHCRVPGVYTPLVWAVDKGDIHFLQLLLAGGKADPSFWTGDKEAIALLKAVLKQHREMVQILVGPTSRLQRTRALALSMDYPDGRIAQILLTNGALPDFKEGDYSTLKQVFDDGPDAIDDILVSTLIQAVLRGHINLVKLLVARGAKYQC
jgi:ankyrin repeat protein